MDFIDNAVVKAKEVFDVAYKKTSEVVNTQKQKFDIASLENKRAKDFEKIGKIYFEAINDTEIEDESLKELVNSVKEKNRLIEELRSEVNAAKNKTTCPNCNAAIEKNSVFCSACGAKIED